MGRFSVNEAENYGSSGGGGYFKLQNDKDTARVRFMYNGIDDIEGYAVHEVEVDGKKRYVNCLRESYNSSIDDCPFCKAGRFQQVKYFMQLFNEDTKTIQTWERGKKFGTKISSICARYPHLINHTFDIERNGKAGDMATTYEIYPVGSDNVELADLPEKQEIIGNFVLDKSADELKYYLDHDCFPDGDNGEVRRRSDVPTRRTPNSQRESF